MNAESQVRLAARLYEMRDTAKTFNGDRWPDRGAEWQRVICAVMKRYGLAELPAATMLAEGPKVPPLAVAEIMGAAVEMNEGGRRRE